MAVHKYAPVHQDSFLLCTTHSSICTHTVRKPVHVHLMYDCIHTDKNLTLIKNDFFLKKALHSNFQFHILFTSPSADY